MTTPPYSPLLEQKNANDPIVLSDITAVLTSPSGINKNLTDGQMILRFLPDPRCEIKFPAPNEGSSYFEIMGEMMTDNSVWRLTFENVIATAGCDVLASSFGDHGLVLLPSISPINIVNEDALPVRCVCRLLNWPKFCGPDDFILKTEWDGGFRIRSLGQIEFELNDWRILVAETGTAEHLYKSLRESGGYAITHVMQIEKADKASFSIAELEDLLDGLTHFFSFALGRWAGPQLAIGMDGNGDRVFQQWGLGRCTSGNWRGSTSWFSDREPNVLAEVLPGFWSLWSQDVWKKALREMIYWYVSANNTGNGVGVDSGLLFTQAALELLAWTYCVKDKRLVSEEAFGRRGGLSAANKLRLLVGSLGIPTEIPEEMTSLRSRRGRAWTDSMDAITDLRNKLVHPSERSFPTNAFSDAWRLSLWYLEMIVLRLSGYNGKYSNRITRRVAGEIEDVPWSS